MSNGDADLPPAVGQGWEQLKAMGRVGCTHFALRCGEPPHMAAVLRLVPVGVMAGLPALPPPCLGRGAQP